MTNSDIIQSMHSCANDTTCARCLYQQHYQNGCCQSKLIGDALELIKRQQEEFERLTEEKDNLVRNYKELVKHYLDRMEGEDGRT